MIQFLSILLIPIFLNACSYNWGATTEIKKASFEEHQDEWQSDKPVRATLLSRSVQVFPSEKVTIKEGKSLKGGADGGLACLVTSDGYALTANHVVDSPPHCVLRFSSSDGEKDFFHLSRVSERSVANGPPQKIEPYASWEIWNSVGFVIPSLKTRVIEKVPVRVVYQWPDSDLALIKIPTKGHAHFTVAKSPPALGEVLFATGNSFYAAPRTSAGRVLKQSLRVKSSRLMTSVPLAPGDSGGPAVDTDGNLVGVASRVYPAIGRQLLRFTNSSFFLSESDELQRLIEEDRRKN